VLESRVIQGRHAACRHLPLRAAQVAAMPRAPIVLRRSGSD